MRIAKKKFAFLVFLVAISLLGISSSALALDWPAAPGPGGIKLCPRIAEGCSAVSTLTQAIEYFWRWAIVLGGLAAFIMLLVAGFQYLTSTGDPGKTKDARDRIASAIGGLVLLLASFIILNVINPELTVLRTPELTISEKPQSLNFRFDSFAEDSCKEVTVYENANQNGAPRGEFRPDAFGALTPKIGTTIKLGSLKIDGSCLALLYPSSDLSGDAIQFSTNIPNLNVFYNDGFGSIRVLDNTPQSTQVGENPTLTLKANGQETQATIQPGENVILSWQTSAGIKDCQAFSEPASSWRGNKNLGAQNSETIPGVTNNTTFSLTCTGTAEGGVGSSQQNASVLVLIGAPVGPAPTADLKISAGLKPGVNPDGPLEFPRDFQRSGATISWTSTNAQRCESSGAELLLTRNFATSGNEPLNFLGLPIKTYEYKILCTGSGGAASDALRVRVTR